MTIALEVWQRQETVSFLCSFLSALSPCIPLLPLACYHIACCSAACTAWHAFYFMLCSFLITHVHLACTGQVLHLQPRTGRQYCTVKCSSHVHNNSVQVQPEQNSARPHCTVLYSDIHSSRESGPYVSSELLHNSISIACGDVSGDLSRKLPASPQWGPARGSNAPCKMHSRKGCILK